MCCSPIYDTYELPEPDGVCPRCGEPTFDGQAIDGCTYSPVVCDVCEHSPCDLSC